MGEYSDLKRGFIIALLAINTVVLAVLWFGSIKDLVFSVSYALLHKKLDKSYAEIEEIRIDAEKPRRVSAFAYIEIAALNSEFIFLGYYVHLSAQTPQSYFRV